MQFQNPERETYYIRDRPALASVTFHPTLNRWAASDINTSKYAGERKARAKARKLKKKARR